MPTGYQLGSLNLRTLGINIATTDGWDSFPGMKNVYHEPGYRHGYFVPSGKRWVYQDRDIVLSLTILPQDPTTGLQTLSPEEHVEANLDLLAGVIFSGTTTPLLLTKTMPSGLVKTIRVLPRTLQTISQDSVSSRRVVLVLNAPYPFWHGGAQEVHTGLTGSFSLDNDGNAPINDMIITFNAAVSLVHTASGATIVTTAGGLTLDVGKGSLGLTGGDQDEIATNRAWLMEMQKGTNAFTCSGGSVDISYYHGYLT